MTEPNLDEQVSDFMASLFIKHRVYHAEPDPAVVAEWVEFIANQVREARIDELKQIEPPEQYIDYAMISGNDACAMCGFNAIKFREYIEDRTATLKGVKKK